MMRSLAITWRSVDAWPMVAGALLLAAAIVVWAYRRRGPDGRSGAVGRRTRWTAAALRLAVLTGLALIWLGPGRSIGDPASRAEHRPKLIVLLDRSGSMAATDSRDRSRLRRLTDAWLPPEVWRVLTEFSDPRLYSFDATARPMDLSAARRLAASNDASTALYKAIERASVEASVPGAGATLLVLSDGHETGDPDKAKQGAFAALADTLAARGVTVFASPPAAEAAEAPDYALTVATDASTVFADEPVGIEAMVTRDGETAGRAVAVDLLEGGEVVQSAEVSFRPGQRRRVVRFEHLPTAPPEDRPRSLFYTARLRPVERERVTTNNQRALAVRQLGRRMRVLLLEGEPGWPSRYLMAAMRRDRRVALTGVQAVTGERTLIARPGTRDNDRPSIGPAFADRLRSGEADVLERFDAVVLGRRVDRLTGVSGARALAGFVEAGGGLWLARGDPFAGDAAAAEVIAALSPVQWGERFVGPLRLSLERAADDEQALGLPGDMDLDKLPRMLAGTRSTARGSATVVWMRQAPVGEPRVPRSAAIASHRVGAGRVVATLSEGFWRWAMLPPRLDAYRTAYEGMVWALVRRAALGEAFEAGVDLSIEATPINATVGRPVRVAVRGRFIDSDALAGAVEARVEGPTETGRTIDLSPDPVAPGRLVGSFAPETAGAYTLTASAPGMENRSATVSILATARADELADTSPRPAWLGALAEGTGGRMLEPGQWRPLVAHLEARSAALDRGEGARTSATTEPAWDRLWVFALLAGALTVEWFVRRGGGMR